MDVAVLGTTDVSRALAARAVDVGHDVAWWGADANRVMDAVDAIDPDLGVDAGSAVDATTGLEAAVTDAETVVDATNDPLAERRERLAAAEDAWPEDALVTVAGGADLAPTALAAGLQWPALAAGLHPVDPSTAAVLEVVVADQTAAETTDRAVSFVESLDATPLVVADAPGFVSARLDLAAIAEAVRVVEAGVASVDAVDRAMEAGRGDAVGPLARADRLGLDAVLDALEDLGGRLGPRYDPPGLLRERVAAGATGRASGEGFYAWENDERGEPAVAPPSRADAPDPGPPEDR